MNTVIDVQHVTKTYGGRRAVDDVSLQVEEGEIFGILGPNGAGKTTTVECVAGLRAPDSGQIRVLGLDPRRDRDALRQQLGVQLQESELPDKLTRLARRSTSTRRSTANPADWRTLLAELGLARQAQHRGSRSCPAARSSACRSRSRWSATRGSRSSTS